MRDSLMPLVQSSLRAARGEEGDTLPALLYKFVHSQLVQAAHRKYAEFLWAEKSYLCHTDSHVLQEPNLNFVQWVTDQLLAASDSGGAYLEQLSALQELYGAWAVTLRSPSMSLKEHGFRRLCDLLEKVSIIDQQRQVEGDANAVDWEPFYTLVPSERVEAMAMRRLDKEKEDAPRYSRYVQCLVEFASLLRFVREKIGAAEPGTPRLERADSVGSRLSRQKSATFVSQPRPRFMLRFQGGANSYVTVNGDDLSPPWTAEFWVRRSGKAGKLRSCGRTQASVAGYTPGPRSSGPPDGGKTDGDKKPKKASHKVLASSHGGGFLLECGRLAKNHKWVGLHLADGSRGLDPFLAGTVLPYDYEAPVGEWTHLAFVATSAGVTLLANGVEVGCHKVKMSLPMSCIGAKVAGFSGELQEVRYWRSARSAGEILRDMRQQLDVSVRPWTLLGYWTLNEGRGRYVTDITEQQDKCFAHGASWAVSEAPPTVLAVPRDEQPPAASEGWNQWTGPFLRAECAPLGGRWAQKYRQAFSLSWQPVGADAGAAQASLDAAKALRLEKLARLTAPVEGEEEEGFDETDATLVQGVVEWPEYDAICRVVGHVRDGVSLCLYVVELKSGPPDVLSWLVGLRLVGSVEGSEFSGSWNAVANAVPPPVVKESNMHAFPLLCSSKLTLSDKNAKVEVQPDSTSWGTVICPLGAVLPAEGDGPEGPALVRSDSGRRGGRGGYRSGGRHSKYEEGWRALQTSNLLLKSGRVTVEMKVVAVGASSPSTSSAPDRRMIGFGIAVPGCAIDSYLGEDTHGWSYQGTGETWHGGNTTPYFKQYGLGDTVAFEIDFEKDTIEYIVNNVSGGVAFSGFVEQGGDAGFVPAVSLYTSGDAVALVGLKSGEGERIFHAGDSQERVKYTGSWKDGDMNGWGVLEYKSGLVLEGEFSSGRPNGIVRQVADGETTYLVYSDGDVAEECGSDDYDAAKEKHMAERAQAAAAKSAQAAGTTPEGKEEEEEKKTEEPTEVFAQVSGTFTAFNDQLFVFSPGLTSPSLTLDDDLCTVTANRGGSYVALGSRGFSRGVHYWEVHVESQRERGDVFIGVAERQPYFDSWRDYGFVSYCAVQSTRGGERLYGSFYIENDYIGVLLNMDEGYLAFIKDAEMYGEHKVEVLGIAFDHVRSGSKGGPKSRLLFPCVGLKNHSGNKVSIRNCKWLSQPGQPARTALSDMLEAATLLRRWDRPSSQIVEVPQRVLLEAHGAFKKMARQRTILCETRAGVMVEFDRSAAACQRTLEMPMERPIRGGTRVRTTRG